MSIRKWTDTARKMLFEELVSRFGPHAQWEKVTSPGRGLDKEYNEFCQLISDIVEADGVKAVKHQIAFGSPVAGVATWSHGLAQNAIFCLAAALEAKFIAPSELPDLIAKRPSRRRSKKRRTNHA